MSENTPRKPTPPDKPDAPVAPGPSLGSEDGATCGCGHSHTHEGHHHEGHHHGGHHHGGHRHEGHRSGNSGGAAQDKALASVSELLASAGYRPGDPESFKRGAAALMAAQMVALASGLADGPAQRRAEEAVKPGRNDPCPCGSGKKYKKCCLPKEEAAREGRAPEGRVADEGPSRSGEAGPKNAPGDPPSFGGVDPAMIPRISLTEMQADTVRLAELFVHDPSLRRCRFPLAAVLEHLAQATPEAPAEEKARDQWLAEQAHAFVVAAQGPSPTPGESPTAESPSPTPGESPTAESPSPKAPPAESRPAESPPAESPLWRVMRSVKDALLEASPRFKEDRGALRALALGLLFHSTWSPQSEQPHPLETLLFRLALHEAAQSQAARYQVLSALGGDPDAAARRLAAGDPEAARALAGSLDTLPEERREALLEAAERYHDQVVDAIVAGRFSVPLPLVSVLPLVIETVHVIRQTGAQEAKQAAQELAVKRAREGLSAPDRALFAELCDAWLASPEHTEDAEDPEAADRVRYARGLAGTGGASLEAVLLLAFLDHHRVTPLPGEPNPDPAEGLEIDSPEFLETYGAFLVQRGNLKLALRTFKLCRFAGEIPPSVRARIEEVEAALSSQN